MILFKKMLRDMKHNLSQFIAIFLLSILGVAVFAGINAEWNGMRYERDRYYADTHLPDFWLMGSDYSKGDLEKAAEIHGVEAASRRFIADAVMVSEKKPVIRINIVEHNDMSKPHLTEGEPFDLTKDGVWLDSAFAEAHGMGVGDVISMEVEGITIEKRVLGLIMHPEYVYSAKDESQLFPQPENFGFAFMPRVVLPESFPLPYNQLMVELDHTVDKKEVKAEIEKRFEGAYSVILTHETHVSTSLIEMEIQQNKAMGNVFPVVFFLIAALAMLTTMIRMTGNQRIQIGTLKAMGFGRRKILFHYVSYGVWIGLVGGFLGLIIGPLIVPPILFEMQRSIYYLPDWYAVITPAVWAVLALAVLCCGASSYFACRRELKDVPAASMRPKPPKAGRHTRWEKSTAWHKLGFSAQWNIRDILRSRIRSVMAVAGVAGCMALLLCALGIQDTMNGLGKWMYQDLHTYAYKINLKEGIHQDDIHVLEEKYEGQLIQESAVEIIKDGKEKTGFLTVVEPGEQMRFQDPEQNALELPDSGVAMSYKMAQLLDIKEGEEIQWRITGMTQWHRTRVETFYRSPMGQGIAMTSKAFEATSEVMKPSALLTSQNAQNADQLSVVKDVKGKDEMKAGLDKTLESMQMLVGILILAAVILGAVVLYNLGALSFTERVRELATLRVLGFFHRQIRSLLNRQNMWLTFAGILLGIPCGYALITFIVSTLSDAMDMLPRVGSASLILCMAGTMALSMSVSLLMSRRVGSIDMVSSLKAVE